jgi:hypothetical protein
MSSFKSSIRLRLVILASLIVVTAYTAMPQRPVSACIECVRLTGGLCVGCDPNVTVGFNFCTPNQDNCSCAEWGACGGIND